MEGGTQRVVHNVYIHEKIRCTDGEYTEGRCDRARQSQHGTGVRTAVL